MPNVQISAQRKKLKTKRTTKLHLMYGTMAPGIKPISPVPMPMIGFGTKPAIKPPTASPKNMTDKPRSDADDRVWNKARNKTADRIAQKHDRKPADRPEQAAG